MTIKITYQPTEETFVISLETLKVYKPPLLHCSVSPLPHLTFYTPTNPNNHSRHSLAPVSLTVQTFQNLMQVFR